METPNPASWTVLLVEDDDDDYLILKSVVAEMVHRKVDLQRVSSGAEAREALSRQTYDAVLVDYLLGDMTGLDLIQEMTLLGLPCPMILLTGMGTYELDMEAMRVGAVDYLSKSELNAGLLERTIRYAIERKQTEQSLIQINEQLAQARDDLERRVLERTLELRTNNAALQAEIQRRIQLEAELAEVQRRLIDRVETERLELAQELHDGPMQELYGISYGLAGLNGDLPENLRPELSAQQARLQNVIAALRTIAREMRPPALAPFGLEKAIRSHVESFQQNYPDMEIRLHLTPDEQALPEPVRLALFRVYHTAMINVIRHAEATRITVTFTLDPQTIFLEVSDNGKGFEVPKRWYEFAREGHLGLAGAAERAEAVGGRLEVISAPGKGTTIRVIAPREQEEEEQTARR